MDDLTSPVGLVALAACALALLAVLLGLVLLRRVGRLRAAQRVVLGDRGVRDLGDHAAGLDADFRALHAYVTDAAQGLDGRLAHVEARLEGTIAHAGLVRYDAYNEMSGRQSTSLALLDGTRSGIVLSAIHHRDQARLYVKQVHEGRGELTLAPEEEEAVRLASP